MSSPHPDTNRPISQGLNRYLLLSPPAPLGPHGCLVASNACTFLPLCRCLCRRLGTSRAAGFPWQHGEAQGHSKHRVPPPFLRWGRLQRGRIFRVPTSAILPIPAAGWEGHWVWARMDSGLGEVYSCLWNCIKTSSGSWMLCKAGPRWGRSASFLGQPGSGTRVHSRGGFCPPALSLAASALATQGCL